MLLINEIMSFPSPIRDQVVMPVIWLDFPWARVRRFYNKFVTFTLFLPFFKKLPYISVLWFDLISTLN